MKEKLFIIFGSIFFVCICCASYYFIFEKDYTYYTQIDNTRIKELSTNDNMKYEYSLLMFDKNGTSKNIRFKTSRELRENAFIKVKYYIIGGVNKWEEVKYNELPDKVKKHYEK